MNRVTFVGGPYDGCTEVNCGYFDLNEQVEMPVSPNILRLLNDEKPGREAKIRSVAVYRLVRASQGPQFRFLRSRPPMPGESDNLAQWHHSVLESWGRV